MKLSIQTKLVLITSSIILLVISVMGFYFLFRERGLVRENIVSKAGIQVNRLASSVSNSWFSTDRDLFLVDTMATYRNVTSLLYLFIVDDNDQIIAQTVGKELKLDKGKATDLFVKAFPQKLKQKQREYKKIDEPLIEDWISKEEDVIDFYLPLFHPIRKNEIIAKIRMGISTREISEKTREATITILTITFVLLLIGVGLGFLIGYYFSKPIVKLAGHALALGGGDFSLRINLKRGDELGKLAEAFDSMAQSLEDGERLKLEKARIDEQIELAREIQEGLNPSGYYNKEGLQIKGYTKAAKGVGGDYFDFIDIDERRVAVLVSDVSGKDIPASLIMIMIRTVFNTLLKTNIPLTSAMIVRSVNAIMASDFAIDKFATMLFMIIDRQTGELFFTNAGHNPVLVYRNELSQCTHVSLDGLPIGVDEESEYNMGRTFLQPGDVTILYSDGVTEAWNNEKEEYQKHRIIKNLKNYHDLSAKEINERIIDDVWEFVGDAPQHDDTTLVVVKKT